MKKTYQSPETIEHVLFGGAPVCQSGTLDALLSIDSLTIEGFNEEAADIFFLDY